jgi:tetratricopeptide (TPR) repeat protein
LSSAGQDSEPTYRAFISYSHHDLAAAKRLHARLERYRIPKRLVGNDAPRGLVPARLTPIFRDIDELPAADDLSAEIKAALAASGALIVICSPSARASRWVNREIETFRDLHGESRPVLAALVEGEPGDAFPEALAQDGPEASAEKTKEPVAADFRKGQDGRALAELKLVAGLTGLGLDTLVQRDAQARLRRVTAITVIAAVAVIAMAALTWTAITARNDAQRQRAEAEGLVEYMLTDLRDKLKGVGRLDVMTAVNERAMRYYGGQDDLGGLSSESLSRRARVLVVMGEDDENRGNLGAAKSKYLEAYRTSSALMAKSPNSVYAAISHVDSVNRIALLEYYDNNVIKSLGKFNEARRILDNIPSSREFGPHLMRLKTYVYGNICSASFRTNADNRHLLNMCLKSVSYNENLIKSYRYDIYAEYDLVSSYAWLSRAYHKNNKYSLADEYIRKSIKLSEQIYNKRPRDRRIQERYMESQYQNAIYYLERDNFEQSMKHIIVAEKIIDELGKYDSSNNYWISFREKIDKLKGEIGHDNTRL